jgi:hypothetical protein
MGQYYTAKNFFMEVKSEDDLDFAQRYTKSICNKSVDTEDISQVLNDYSYLFEKGENNKYYYTFFPRTSEGGREILELSEDELIRFIGCVLKCDKIKMNNWARYCSSECPYYFNTDNLKKIFIGGR